MANSPNDLHAVDMAAEGILSRVEIAVYGKGGIGKSTVAANLSAALALEGRRVLQIGCDPKHDSTRVLMAGRSIPTVLDYLRDTKKDQAVIDGILHEGSFGVGCVEAGGPKPGVGCAGRGIISAFEFLDRNHVKEDYDTVIYDVLGDVVCGGFAVPIRSEYADAIFLVTSGEYMALYAANNILRGIRNYDGDERCRVAGIIFNARNLPEEQLRVERFAQATGLPIVVRIPRSPVFAEAERINCTVMELDGHRPEQDLFKGFAQMIVKGLELKTAKPLTDDALERCILYGDYSDYKAATSSDSAFADGASSTEVAPTTLRADAIPQSSGAIQGLSPRRPALYGCAFNGAATTAIHLTDAVVIAHSPRACAFYTWQNISSPGRKNLFHRGVLMPSAISPHLECTEINQHEAVFGATDKLRRHVQEAIERKPGAVVVISSCVSGIIGDDVLSVEQLATPEVPVIVIPADGDIAGDYMEGIRMCLHGVAEVLVDPRVDLKPNCVNLIGETGVANDLEINHRILETLLGRMGISINCRFMGDATADEVRNLVAAPLSILASDGQDNQELKEWLENRYELHFLDSCMPIGFEETRSFLEKVGAFFGCPEKAASIVADEQERFENDLAALRTQLVGKRLVITTINANLDWLLDVASAVGMEVAWIGVLNYLNREMGITAFPDKYPFIESISSLPEVIARIEELKPDFVVSAFAFTIPSGDYIVDNMPMVQQVGFHSGIQTLARWARLQQNEVQGSWIDDKELFEKYFA